MSDNISSEIQEEIIKRLPIKSVIQFRSVSKAWKSLIDSPDFIKHYRGQQQHLLDKADFNEKNVSIVDDDSFPNQKVSVTRPLLLSILRTYIIIGSSHGLLCLYSNYPDGCDNTVVLWNVSIRKVVGVDVRYDSNVYDTFIGFGVCGETMDPKIVKITYIGDWTQMGSILDDIPLEVEVFSLSTGAWRPPYTNHLLSKSIHFIHSQVVVDGFLYWLAMDRIALDDGFNVYKLIVSFDMTSEEFKEINLPDKLANKPMKELYLCKLRESLVVLEDEIVVWIMEGGVEKSFAKLFTIYTPVETILTVLEFRKNGEPVVEYENELTGGLSLAVYDPNSKHFSNLEINGRGSHSVYSYAETLLLLGQPEFTF